MRTLKLSNAQWAAVVEALYEYTENAADAVEHSDDDPDDVAPMLPYAVSVLEGMNVADVERVEAETELLRNLQEGR